MAIDPYINIGTQLAVNISHFKIAKIETFRGFRSSSSGEILLNKPIWRTITESDLESTSVSKFCRAVSYKNHNFCKKK